MRGPKYRHIVPTLVDAIQFTGSNIEAIIEWLRYQDHHKAARVNFHSDNECLSIATTAGTVITFAKTHWIIVQADGMIARATDATFRETYEVAQ